MDVLSILRNEVEIYRCVTVRQHVLESPVDGYVRRDIRGSYWSGMYVTPKDTIVV